MTYAPMIAANFASTSEVGRKGEPGINKGRKGWPHCRFLQEDMGKRGICPSNSLIPGQQGLVASGWVRISVFPSGITMNMTFINPELAGNTTALKQ